MEITIIGWYGTETIGDRAILAGIFRILAKSFGTFRVRLGSLYPFYTKRALLEDYEFHKRSALNDNLIIKVFDSRNPCELKQNVKSSDLLMIGGGPLMDLIEMSMLKYAFSIASRYKIKSIIMGCGWGPLKTEKAINIARNLVKESSVAIMRDDISKEQAILNGCDDKIISILDPAFIACQVFLETPVERTNYHVSINFRDVTLESDNYLSKRIPLKTYVEIVRCFMKQTDLPINLVPMHNFFIGGDDRIILNTIAEMIASERIHVIQKPYSLFETMSEFYHARYCVGMRFHSVVLQTILNGRNFIIDYTDPTKGKIISMIKSVGIEDVYKERIYSLHSDDSTPSIDISKLTDGILSIDLVAKALHKYTNVIKKIIN